MVPTFLGDYRYTGRTNQMDKYPKEGCGKGQPPRWWIILCVPDEIPISNHQAVKIKTIRKRTFPLFGEIVDVTWRGNDYGAGLVYALSNYETVKTLATRIGNLEVRSYGKEFQGWTLQVDRRFRPTNQDWAASRVPGSGVRRGSGKRETTASSLGGKH